MADGAKLLITGYCLIPIASNNLSTALLLWR
jgi:hypothetical protein